jgi:hypothetical protein
VRPSRADPDGLAERRSDGIVGARSEHVIPVTRAASRARVHRIDAARPRVAAELSDGYAGTVRLKVDHGTGSLEPGASRELRATLHLPDHLLSGRTYEGTWRIANLGYNVEVETADGNPSQEKVE